MEIAISRGRLLAGAALGLGLALVPQQAQASCVVSPPATPVTGTDRLRFDTTPPTRPIGGVSARNRPELQCGYVRGSTSRRRLALARSSTTIGLAFTQHRRRGANGLVTRTSTTARSRSMRATPPPRRHDCPRHQRHRRQQYRLYGHGRTSPTCQRVAWPDGSTRRDRAASPTVVGGNCRQQRRRPVGDALDHSGTRGDVIARPPRLVRGPRRPGGILGHTVTIPPARAPSRSSTMLPPRPDGARQHASTVAALRAFRQRPVAASRHQ